MISFSDGLLAPLEMLIIMSLIEYTALCMHQNKTGLSVKVSLTGQGLIILMIRSVLADSLNTAYPSLILNTFLSQKHLLYLKKPHNILIQKVLDFLWNSLCRHCVLENVSLNLQYIPYKTYHP